MKRKKLVQYLNKLLNIYDYQDYGPNGLQVEGKEEITKIAFAVSATKYSINKAVELKADALIVHHGLFWKFHGPKTLTGAFKNRVFPLVKNDINLLGYHLPLDGHLEVGNAAQIAQKLELKNIQPFGDYKGMPTGVKGQFNSAIEASELRTRLKSILDHNIVHAKAADEMIKSVGIITGGANSDWRYCLSENLDAYITGEISEHDWHEASEDNVHFFAGGHNATEQFGVQALLRNLHDHFKDEEIECFYIPSENPA